MDDTTQDPQVEEVLPEIPEQPAIDTTPPPAYTVEQTAGTITIPIENATPEGEQIPGQTASENEAPQLNQEVTPTEPIDDQELIPTIIDEQLKSGAKLSVSDEPTPEEMLAPVTEEEKVTLKDEEKTNYRWWMTSVKLERLREAFLMGCDIGEACLYAEITRDQLDYYQDNIDPDYRKKYKLWREKPTLIARNTVVKAIRTDADLALKYLERRKKDEFGLRSEIAAANGAPLSLVIDIVKENRKEASEGDE